MTHPKAIINPDKPCRHEYVKIFQRKLKGLDRRMVATRGFLPIGFKQADFGHLSEGSFCFCTHCRTRLFPRRTAGEKLAARQALLQSKALESQDLQDQEEIELVDAVAASHQEAESEPTSTPINVEELELEATDMQDLEANGVTLADEDDDDESLSIDEDI